MKLLVWYVEKCKINKGFRIKSSVLVGLIVALIAMIVNANNGLDFDVCITSGALLGLIWIPFWLLIIMQSIKFRDKREEYERLQIEKEKEEKRRRTEEKLKNKKKNRKKNKKDF